MTKAFFPGCKVRAKYPEESKRLAQAVMERGWADVKTGCCRKKHQELTPADTVVCYCTACHAGLEAGGKKAVNLLQLVFGA